MCLEERSFGSCSAWEMGDKCLTWGERCAWGGLGIGGNYVN